ncbi:MAG: hypothetical protein ACM3ZC_15480 [Bacteroidota bacterium]
MMGYRKLIVGIAALVLATVLLLARYITPDIWRDVIKTAITLIVAGNVVSNAAGSLGAALSQRPQSAPKEEGQ